MPIRASSTQGDIHAFELDPPQWAELKASYRAQNLSMPCCGVVAVPKTSNRGNFFFAHARRGKCATADESAEHLYCKTLIARAAKEAGWLVTTERPGVSPGGEQWVADVFCEKGSARIALEVQMSPQTDEETRRRQVIYRESGVRGAWFFGPGARKSGVVPNERETPAFALGGFKVGEVPSINAFGVSLPEFVTALLQKRVAWTIPRYPRPHLVQYVVDTCWSCRKPVKQLLEHMKGGDSVADREYLADDFYEGRWHPTPNTVPNISNRLEALQRDIDNELLAGAGLNLVGRQDVIRGKVTRFPFCNVCLHCGVAQNNHFLSELISEINQRDPGDVEAWILPEQMTSEAPEVAGEEVASPIGVAVIPREIEGPATWRLLDP